jgi:hypothetical protein
VVTGDEESEKAGDEEEDAVPETLLVRRICFREVELT